MIDITEAINKSKAQKIQAWPVNSNRASEIGHPCLKYLVLLRTRWQDRALHDVGLQYIFDDGKLHEKGVLEALREAGIEFVHQQRPFELKEQKITGSVDGSVVKEDEIYPTEIKSINPWNWEKIPSWQTDPDGWRIMLTAEKVWLRKWPFQLMIYLFMAGEEEGVMLLKNKLSSKIKQLVIKLDYEITESILKKCEIVNAHVENKTLPETVDYEDWICEGCSFLHICLPDIDLGKGMELEDDPELEQMLEMHEQLKPQAKECDEIWKTIKKKVEGRVALIGDFQVAGNWRERAGYTKEVKASKFWFPKIVRIK